MLIITRYKDIDYQFLIEGTKIKLHVIHKGMDVLDKHIYFEYLSNEDKLCILKKTKENLFTYLDEIITLESIKF